MDPILASVVIFLALCVVAIVVAIVAVVFRDSEVAKAAVDALNSRIRKK